MKKEEKAGARGKMRTDWWFVGLVSIILGTFPLFGIFNRWFMVM